MRLKQRPRQKIPHLPAPQYRGMEEFLYCPHTQNAMDASPWINGMFSHEARIRYYHTRKGVGVYPSCPQQNYGYSGKVRDKSGPQNSQI